MCDAVTLDLQTSLMRAQEEIARLRELLEESDAFALETVIDLVHARCHIDEDGLIDSMALSDAADAMRWLEARGRIRIIKQAGRRVLGEWVV